MGGRHVPPPRPRNFAPTRVANFPRTGASSTWAGLLHIRWPLWCPRRWRRHMSGLIRQRMSRGGARWPLSMRGRRVGALGGLAIAVVSLNPWGPPSSWPFAADAADLSGIHKIQHVVVIMQENRSFDHYFGTYPGADGIPMQNGAPTVCVTDPRSGQCVKPFHDPHDLNRGGPHSAKNAVADVNGGKMDGFIGQVGGRRGKCVGAFDPNCGG